MVTYDPVTVLLSVLAVMIVVTLVARPSQPNQVSEEMILQVLSVFPDTDRQAIREDLERTGNVETTIENALAGRITTRRPPQTPSLSNTSAREQNPSSMLTQRQSNPGATLSAAASSLSPTRTTQQVIYKLRSEMLQSKHQTMVSESRPKFLEFETKRHSGVQILSATTVKIDKGKEKLH